MIEARFSPRNWKVPVPELARLLGYPAGILPRGRVARLARWARRWYRTRGTVFAAGARFSIQRVEGTRVWVADRPLTSETLAARLEKGQAQALLVLGISAGEEVEEEVASLWEQGRVDEAFVLDAYASALVEHLLVYQRRRWGRKLRRRNGSLLPPYSPGYEGWDLSDQFVLLDLLKGSLGAGRFPLQLLESGMLQPEKSLLAVCGIRRAGASARPSLGRSPCSSCPEPGCAYRRRRPAGARFKRARGERGVAS